jgi:hypothetical protein
MEKTASKKAGHTLTAYANPNVITAHDFVLETQA